MQLFAGAVLPIMSHLADVVFYRKASSSDRLEHLKVVRCKLTNTGEPCAGSKASNFTDTGSHERLACDVAVNAGFSGNLAKA